MLLLWPNLLRIWKILLPIRDFFAGLFTPAVQDEAYQGEDDCRDEPEELHASQCRYKG